MSDIKKREKTNSPFDLIKGSIDSVFDDFFNGSSLSLKNMDFAPKVDVTEDEKAIHVKAELPGIDEKNVNVEIKENTLTISGEKKEEKETKEEKSHRIERSYGSFSRSFTLPKGIETDNIKATYKNGVLKINIPKGKELESKKVKVEVE